VPIYEYQCSKCHYRFEKLQRFSDPPASACPQCGGSVSQLLSPSAIQFKGSGWYATDYARKASSAPPSGNGKPANGESNPAPKETTAAPAAEKK